MYTQHKRRTEQSTGADRAWCERASERKRCESGNFTVLCAQNCRGPLAAHNTHKHTYTCPYISPPADSYSNWNCWWVSRWRAQWPAAAAVCVRPVHPSLNFCAGAAPFKMNGAQRPFDAFALLCVELECVRAMVLYGFMRLFMFPLWQALGARRWDTKEVTRVTKLHWTGKRISPRRIIYECMFFPHVRGWGDVLMIIKWSFVAEGWGKGCINLSKYVFRIEKNSFFV